MLVIMRKTLLEILALLGVTLAAAGVTWKSSGGVAPLKEVCDPAQLEDGYICYAEAAQLENVVWVDARTRELWKLNGFPNSILLTDHPSEDWPSLLEEGFGALSMAEAVVVYCSTEGCGSSEPVAQKIQELGLLGEEQIFVLQGGWKSLP